MHKVFLLLQSLQSLLRRLFLLWTTCFKLMLEIPSSRSQLCVRLFRLFHRRQTLASPRTSQIWTTKCRLRRLCDVAWLRRAFPPVLSITILTTRTGPNSSDCEHRLQTRSWDARTRTTRPRQDLARVRLLLRFVPTRVRIQLQIPHQLHIALQVIPREESLHVMRMMNVTRSSRRTRPRKTTSKAKFPAVETPRMRRTAAPPLPPFQCRFLRFLPAVPQRLEKAGHRSPKISPQPVLTRNGRLGFLQTDAKTPWVVRLRTLRTTQTLFWFLRPNLRRCRP